MRITDKDLFLIRDSAVNFMVTLSSRSRYQQDVSQAQSYAFTKAVIMHLNGKKLLTEEIDVDDNLDPHYQKD